MIQILDNFFEKDGHKSVVTLVTTKLPFVPRFYDDKKPAQNNYYGMRYHLNQDKKLLDIFIKQAEKKFSIKILDVGSDCGIDLRNLDVFLPHTDFDVDGTSFKLNLMVMLEGPIAVSNGTVFYDEDKNLDMHVGFRPNRAILFPSDLYHCAHATKDKGVRRYSASVFIKDYEVSS